jgi:sugar (pentulose or hexulose) kinase
MDLFLSVCAAGYADANAMIVASGTALTSSRAWRQMLADAIGRELAMETSAKEATSRGVAVFIGTYRAFHSFAASQQLDAGQIVYAHPNVEAHAAYLAARQQQETLYRKLYQ